MRQLLLLGILLAALAAYGAMLYNGLVHRRNRVRSAFSAIDVSLRERHDLIPALVEAVESCAAHERETLDRLLEARGRILAAGPAGGSGELSRAERLRLEEEVGPRVQRLMALAESEPELRASEQFLRLQRRLEEAEGRISSDRRAYNAAVFDMNNAVEGFPSNLIAGAFGFARHDYFESGEGIREGAGEDGAR